MNKENIKDWGKSIIISALIGFMISQSIAFVRVQGESMSPTLNNKDWLFVTKIFNTYDYEDVIIFDSHNYNNSLYIKRIIGLPGDHIVIKDNKVYRNNKELQEYYLPEDIRTTGDINIYVPENEYFVLGDNRGNSKDSRVMGTIPKEDIKAKLQYRLKKGNV